MLSHESVYSTEARRRAPFAFVAMAGAAVLWGARCRRVDVIGRPRLLSRFSDRSPSARADIPVKHPARTSGIMSACDNDFFISIITIG